MSLSREHHRWLLSLNLSTSVRNPRRDLSNGYLVAEILSRYWPSEVALHSFDPAATAAARKLDAWNLLARTTKKHSLVLSRPEIEALVACDAGAAEALVARLHARLAMEPRPGSEANRVLDSPSAPAEAAPSPRARAASAPRQLHHFFDDARAALPVTAGAARPRAPPSGSSRSGGGEPRSVSAAAWPTQPGPLPLVSALGLADVPALPSPTRRSPSPPPSPHRHSPPPPPEEEEEAPPPLPAPAVAQPGMRRFPSSAAAMAAAAAAAARDPVVAWSLPGDAEGWPSLGADEGGEAWGPDDAGGAGGAWAEEPFEDDGAAEGPPRRAGYTPYTQADYDRLTGPRAYWQLGRLGPDLEEPQLASKRAARARALAFAALAQASNTVRLAASPNRAPPVRMRSASPRARGR